MSKPVIGVDLDGVTACYSEFFRKVLADLVGVAPEVLPPWSDWNWTKAQGYLDMAGGYARVHGIAVDRGVFRSCDVMPGAVEGLQELAKDVDIRIVTHRAGYSPSQRAQVVSDTAYWLMDNEIPYADLCFVSDKHAVASVIHLDDAPHHIEAMRAAGRLVLIYDGLYNRGVKGPRVHNWPEAVKVIQELVC